MARLRSGQSLLHPAALVHSEAVAAEAEKVRGATLNKVLAAEAVAAATLLAQISSAAGEEPAEALAEMEHLEAAMAAVEVLLVLLDQVHLLAVVVVVTELPAEVEELVLASS